MSCDIFCIQDLLNIIIANAVLNTHEEMFTDVCTLH